MKWKRAQIEPCVYFAFFTLCILFDAFKGSVLSCCLHWNPLPDLHDAQIKKGRSMYCPHMVHIHLGIHVVVVGSEMRLLRIGKQAKRRLISFSVSMCVFPFPGFLLGMLPAISSSFLHHRAGGGRGWGPVSV